MFCPNCGKEIEDGAKFCKYCGAEIKEKREGISDVTEEVKTHGKAVASLVLGICGWVIPFVGYVLDILAIVYGAQARGAIRKSAGKLKGEGIATAGFVLGIIGFGVSTIVIMLILGAIAIPRFMGAQNRARIGAAEVDVTKIRGACMLYEIDFATYECYNGTDYDVFVASLVDPDGTPYMDLPENKVTFTFVSYAGYPDSFKITVKAHDTDSTLVYGIPQKTYH